MERNYELMWKASELQDQITKITIDRWLQYNVFTWNWWLLVAFFIGSIIVWIKLVDRERIVEILLYGLQTVFITVYVSSIGKELGFWIYPIELTPFGHRAVTFDVGMISVAYMLIFQYMEIFFYRFGHYGIGFCLYW